MFAVFTGNMKVTNKGFLDHFNNEVFFDTEEKALKSAERRLQKLQENPKMIEYQDGLEIGERRIIGKKEVSAKERRAKLNSLRVQMGLNEL